MQDASRVASARRASKKTVLTVCAVPSLGWKAARALMLDDHHVVLGGPRGLPTWRFLPFCRKYTALEGLRWVAQDRIGQELVDELDVLCREHDVHTVVPGDLAITALMAESPPLGRHPFPLPHLATLERLHDKWGFSQLAAELGLRQPTTYAATDVPLHALRFPVLTKARTLSCGRGIDVHVNRERLAEWLDTQPAEVVQDAIVQEFIEGEDISCSFLADHGRLVGFGCCVRHRGRRIFFRDKGIEHAVESLVDHVGYHGVGDIDFLTTGTPGEYAALEFNPRLAGGQLYYATAGLNLPSLAVRLACGERFVGVKTPRPGLTVLRPSEYLLSFAMAGAVEAARRGLLPGHRPPQAIPAPVR